MNLNEQENNLKAEADSRCVNSGPEDRYPLLKPEDADFSHYGTSKSMTQNGSISGMEIYISDSESDEESKPRFNNIGTCIGTDGKDCKMSDDDEESDAEKYSDADSDCPSYSESDYREDTGCTRIDTEKEPFCGYRDITYKRLKLGKPPICSIVSRDDLILKLKHRSDAVKSEIVSARDRVNSGSTFGNAAILIEIASLERKYRLLGSTLDAMSDYWCDGRSHLALCTCPEEVTKSEDTCTVCKDILKYTMLKNNSKRLVLRSEMLGPALCYCAICLKHRGAWDVEREMCTCYYPHHEYPLDMCTSCLCQLASEQYIHFETDSLYYDERIKQQLLIASRNYAAYIERVNDNDGKLKEKLMAEFQYINKTLMALLPDDAYEGCDSKGHLNACKCSVDNVCHHCKYLYRYVYHDGSHAFDETKAVRMKCNCLKCRPDCVRPNCECKNHSSRQPSSLCTLCLCTLALDMKSGKRICFCSRKRSFYSCGAECCPNPVKYCNHSYRRSLNNIKCEGTNCSVKTSYLRCVCFVDKLWMSNKCKPTCFTHIRLHHKQK
jgi:hypothetical protein